MKYLYVLVNSPTGFYVEQTYVSMLSLKHVSPAASISLLVDDKTANECKNNFFNATKALINEYKVVNLSPDMSAIARSRHLKTTMRQHIRGDFLYVDSDTIWANPINEKEFTFDIMGVLDGNNVLQNNPALDYIQELFKETKCNPRTDFYFNSGVLFSKESTFSHNFFEKWHQYWTESSKSGCFVDQPSLNTVISEDSNLKKYLLPGTYNAQIAFSWDYFFNAKVIHYFTYSIEHDRQFDSPYLLKSKQFWQTLSKDGITPQIQAIIKNPLSAFSQGVSISGIDEINLTKTHLYGLIKESYLNKINGNKSHFDLLEKFVVILSNLFRKNN